MSEQLAATLQWFPGHMKRGERIIEENLKLFDLVIEVLDARIPISSQNKNLQKIIGDKPKLIALTKADLADDEITKKFLKKFREEEIFAVAVNSTNGAGFKKLIEFAQILAEKNTHKLVKFGAKPRAARAMVIGIPNSGKSSLINRLAGENHTKIENKPGITRAKQWIKIADGLQLLDTPGILPPKFEDQDVALKLSWTYAISDEIHDLEPITYLLLEFLAKKNPAGLCGRYKLDELPDDGQKILEKIGFKRGCIRKGGLLDVDKTIKIILSEFRAGKLGKITLDEIPVN